MFSNVTVVSVEPGGRGGHSIYTVDDSGVGQRQLNETASKVILKWSEYHEIHFFFHGLFDVIC